MIVVVAMESRFDRTPDGAVWAKQMDASFFQRYLDVFDGVRVVARVRDVPSVPDGFSRMDQSSVTFAPVPYYVGPLQFLVRSRAVARAVQSAVKKGDAVILRIGSQIAMSMEPELVRTGHPYAVEVVGDPYDVFAPGVVSHPLRPFFRWYFTRAQKRQCFRASAAAYVTKHTLQKRYPCRGLEVDVSDVQLEGDTSIRSSRAFVTHFSSIDLVPESFTTQDVKPIICPDSMMATPIRLIHVGSLEQLYKGTDVLLEAMQQCIASGLDIVLAIVGDGRQRPSLELLASKLGIADRVQFLGMLSAGQAIRDELDRSDLFVLPSRTEGLPRALIEAMARGLPCIGSTAGGIPELLEEEDLVQPGDAIALKLKIIEVVSSHERRNAMSTRNFEKSKEFDGDKLRRRRMYFYHYLRDFMERLNGGG